jgi:O-antigen/teichoic acid export membrane protein
VTGGTEPDAHRLVLRGALATGAGFVVKMGARLGFLLMAGWLFGAAAFGAYSLGVAVVESGVGLAGLSLKKLLFQWLDANESKGEERRPPLHVVADAAVLVLTASSVLALAIMTVTALVVGGLPRTGAGAALFWLAPMIAGQTLVDVLLAASRWRGAIRYEVVGRSIVEPYTQLAVAAAGWAAGVPGWALIAGYWAGNLTVNAYALLGIQRSFGGGGLAGYWPERRRLLRLARSLAPNTATDLLAGVYARLDLYVVGLVLGTRWAGIYSMAQQLCTPVRQIRQSFDGLLVPLVARTVAVRGSAAAGAALASAARLVLAIQLPVVLALFTVGAPLLDLFGPGFAAAWAALVLLAAAEAVQAAFGTADLLFVYLNPRVGLAQTAVGIAVGAGTALLLLPVLGITGAALAVLAGYLVRAAMRAWTLRRRFAVTVPLAHPAGPFLAAALSVGAVLLARPLGDLAALAAGLSAYAAVMLVWLRVTGESLKLTGFEAPAR